MGDLRASRGRTILCAWNSSLQVGRAALSNTLVYVDRLIYVEDCCLISFGVENVSRVLHIELVLL
jgi:hypothetical protein